MSSCHVFRVVVEVGCKWAAAWTGTDNHCPNILHTRSAATQAPQGAFSTLKQRIASLWGGPSSEQQQHGSQSLTASALASLKATAARWLAKKAEDPESREALLAFGSGNLLDFLVSTATEEAASPEQQHAEQAVVRTQL